ITAQHPLPNQSECRKIYRYDGIYCESTYQKYVEIFSRVRNPLRARDYGANPNKLPGEMNASLLSSAERIEIRKNFMMAIKPVLRGILGEECTRKVMKRKLAIQGLINPHRHFATESHSLPLRMYSEDAFKWEEDFWIILDQVPVRELWLSNHINLSNFPFGISSLLLNLRISLILQERHRDTQYNGCPSICVLYDLIKVIYERGVNQKANRSSVLPHRPLTTQSVVFF
ncbi:hypothetical protein STEG23_028680, partial [Scotinomys teguina]